MMGACRSLVANRFHRVFLPHKKVMLIGEEVASRASKYLALGSRGAGRGGCNARAAADRRTARKIVGLHVPKRDGESSNSSDGTNCGETIATQPGGSRYIVRLQSALRGGLKRCTPPESRSWCTLTRVTERTTACRARRHCSFVGAAFLNTMCSLCVAFYRACLESKNMAVVALACNVIPVGARVPGRLADSWHRRRRVHRKRIAKQNIVQPMVGRRNTQLHHDRVVASDSELKNMNRTSLQRRTGTGVNSQDQRQGSDKKNRVWDVGHWTQRKNICYSS